MSEFTHLHVHSDYSLTDSAASIKSLVEKAEKLGMSHLALTDHGNLFGAMEFISICEKRKSSVKPIIGCEVYVAPGSRFDKKEANSAKDYYHLVLLAANNKGYLNLVKLCSLAYIDGFYRRQRVDNDLLKEYRDGLIALSACVSGEIPSLINAGKTEKAKEKAVFYRDLFGKDIDGNPNFYLEIMDHGMPSDDLKGLSLSQKEINKVIADISKSTGIPLVATNDVHYLEKDDYISHDILLCVGTKKKRAEGSRKKFYGDQFYFKSGEEMASLFSEYPQAIENTMNIAHRCKTDVPNRKKELKQFLPKFEIPASFENSSVYLRHLTMEGLKKRYELTDEWQTAQERANFELDTIIKEGYTGYFLIVEDFIRFAREKGIPVGPGRGSGAGSIVAYALKITDIDPLKYNLLFERFLNPERVSMPDFDIDFANEGREDVIKYVTQKYGEDKVGQIITFGRLGAKAVIKDVARVLGISVDETNKITKLIPKDPKITLKKAFAQEPKLKEMEEDARYTELFVHARKLEGLNRNSSIHAAGVVIGKQPLIDLVPLYKERGDSKKGKLGGIATQYSMNYLENCGLIKMDFLGLKTLDVIKNTEELIRQRDADYSDFSIEKISLEDPATYKMLGEGNSFSIFQFEADWMQDYLKQAKPSSIEDLIAMNAMNRPGPMKNMPHFIACKTGKSPITFPDPSLKEILKETYGVTVYQEQVMKIAQIIAGFSLGHADELRRAMGKKIMEVMVKERVKFIEGAKEKGFSEKKAEDIYKQLEPFAEYGFNKSHSAAYAVIAYQTAYLKANFPAEFMAANLTNEINATDKDRLPTCIEETRKMGFVIEPPDINKSNMYFSVVNGCIIYGFMGIKGIGEAPVREIISHRQNGPYKSFIDFLDRVDIKLIGKKVIELLVKTGAFDNFGISRETLEGNFEKAVEYALKKKEDKEFGQTNLFEDAGESDMPDFKFEEFKQKSRFDRLNEEKKLIGFYFSGHPMDEYRELWQNTVNVNIGDTENLKPVNCVLVGIIKKLKTINTKKGTKMAFAVLSDYNGDIEVTFFPAIWEKISDKIENDRVSILKGKIDFQKDKEKYSFITEEVLGRQEVSGTVKELKETEEKDKVHKIAWKYMADLKSSYIHLAKKGNYTIIGYLKRIREHKDRNENDMAFGTLADFEGDIDLVFFYKVFAECRHLLNINEIIAFKGSIDPDNERSPEKISFRVTSVADFPQLSRSALRKEAAGEEPLMPELRKIVEEQLDEVHVKLKAQDLYSDESLSELRDYLAENSGSSTIYIHIPVAQGEQKIKTVSGLNIAKDTLDGLRKCKCVSEVWRV
ncbi:MAG: DNA polymerase III subunit alpha [Treponema sp.]|nr:DNA polymerase III subunit alpha [Treponema sp.]